MSLQVSHRPQTLIDIVGNAHIIASMQSVVKRENPPSTFLFTGPGGTGKTTMARILATMLGVHPSDITEQNASDERGIDAVRKLSANLKFSPLHGKRKFILMDECFSANTKINTINGTVDIQDIKLDDVVFNINGTDIVEMVFKNKIKIDKVTKLNKSDGTHTFCSSDHLFFNNGKWIKAKDLTNSNLLYYVSEHAHNNSSLIGCKNDENMQELSGLLHSKKEKQNVLFNFMLCILQRRTQNKTCKRKNLLQMVQSIIYTKNQKNYILCQKLLCKIRQKSKKKKQSFRKHKKENTAISYKTATNRRRETIDTTFFRENDKKQSYAHAGNKRENDKHTKNKWYTKYLAWETWRKWAINSSPNPAYDCIGMGSGNCNFIIEETEELSNKLQSGYRKQETENCNRSRWKESQKEEKYIVRCKEDKKIRRIRVESVEIYKRGDNDESFKSVITSKEHNQGYVEFYDLQISNHPSYIADGLMVHNCHSLTKPSQEALLKTLEEPPPYVHIALCTTNPEALKQTFKRRCHQYELEHLNTNELMFLLKRTLIAEKVSLQSIHRDVAEKIVDLADGSAGQAMKLLDMVIDMKNRKEALKTLSSVGISVGDPEVIEICRLLVDAKMNDKTRWVRIRDILKVIKTDGESARRPILGYLNTVLLSSGRMDVAETMTHFMDNYFDNGKAGLTLSCFMACHKEM